ncbi:MAG: ABC transporter ATP-binding protein [Carboxydocellales bacterium]
MKVNVTVGLVLNFRIRGQKATLEVLKHLSLEVQAGEFVSIIGPSGCGKSTLFRVLSGLESLDEGSINLQGAETGNLKGLIGYMPQKDMLMPWRRVIDNAVLGLELKGVPLAQARAQALTMMEEFGLTGFADYYPNELSGGMRQRVALLRTMLPGQNILLLDEPFGALDAITRLNMQAWLLEVWQKHAPAVLFITHDIEEAIYLSDRIYVFSPRPAKVRLEVKVDLARPRSKRVFSEGKFIQLKQQILEVL